MKIIAMVETYNFRNYTRRATFEAIDKIQSLDYLVLNNRFKKRKIISDFEKNKIIEIKTFIPRSSKLFLLEKFLFKKRYTAKFSQYDVVIISSPNQWFLAKLIPKNIIVIFLISDPYHLMDDEENFNIKEQMINIINRADIILTTSINLKEIYLKKYFNFFKDNIFYWPNCVDEKIWSYKSFVKSPISKSEKKIIGFAGNFMNVTDIDLLDYITDALPQNKFRIAGKISFLPHEIRLKTIFNKVNVEYLNYISFQELQSEVASWDVCLLLDKKSEFASYHHHNKIYQYLALGKPVVLLDYMIDYVGLMDTVYIAKNKLEYLSNIIKALNEENPEILFENRVHAANLNSSSKRADDFFSILELTTK